jgi:glutaredoxin 3
MSETRQAILYRMVLSDHVCPYGLQAKSMLEDAGYQIDDRILTTRDEVDRFLNENGVDTTPQVFIDGRCIGGSDELKSYLLEGQTAI